MSLKMRPTGLSSAFYKDIDYSVFCGEWCVVRIYETRPDPLHCAGSGRYTLPASQEPYPPITAWRWTRRKPSSRRASWKRWKAWRRWKR
jgi:hypothetical protein